MATAKAGQLGSAQTLGLWTPRALRRARAKLPASVLATLGQPGVGVPAGVPAGVGNRQSAIGNGRGVASGEGGSAGAGVGLVGDRAVTCPNLRVRMTGRGHRAPDGAWLDDAAGRGGVTTNGVEATTDLADRAHREYRGELLANGRSAMHAVPREYHAMYMVGPAGRRVSVETAIERVEACAHACGLHRGPSMGEAVAGVLVRADAGQVRSVVRGVKVKDRYGETAAERAEAAAVAEHERVVAELLARSAAGVGREP